MCGANCWTGSAAAVDAGVDESLIVLDPGLGFAKTADHNWSLLRALPTITGLVGPGWGFPVLIGASRKRFLGALLADAARASSARRPGGGHHRDLRAGRRGRGLGCPGARGVRHHWTRSGLPRPRPASRRSGV